MKTVVLLSGGLDSAVLLAHVKARGDEVLALSVEYGQRHVRELKSAAEVARHFEVPRVVVDMGGVAARSGLFDGSSQTDPFVDVPEGRYDDASMRATVVPNRNMVLLALAGAFAISKRAHALAYAAHSGDHAIYPDCRPGFVAAMRAALGCCDYEPLVLDVPFLDWSKADIVRRGLELRVPFGVTWTCYRGLDVACGKCGSCSERLEAFETVGVVDPLPYKGRK